MWGLGIFSLLISGVELHFFAKIRTKSEHFRLFTTVYNFTLIKLKFCVFLDFSILLEIQDFNNP